MKTSTRIIGIVAAVVLSAALFAGGFLLGRSSLGLAGFGFNGVRGGNFGFGMLNWPLNASRTGLEKEATTSRNTMFGGDTPQG